MKGQPRKVPKSGKKCGSDEYHYYLKKYFTTKYTKNHEEKQKMLLNFMSFVLFVVGNKDVFYVLPNSSN